MPVIRVEMFKRTQEQKKEAIKSLITEVDENNWASGGIITSDKKN